MSNISLNKVIRAIGVMSGTSLDGLDLAYCVFDRKNGRWEFDVIRTKTIEYTDKWHEYLGGATNLSGEHIAQLDVDFGRFTARKINRFIREEGLAAPDLIASHGHTVFHQPENGFTLQIGSGAVIAAQTGIEVVSDFRTQDIALGGQGAPLVPVGDKLLFPQYDACLNLGGFSNISFDTAGTRVAFDICPLNIVLNKYSAAMGFPFDEGGRLAAGGKINGKLLRKLNNLPYYAKSPPKSLGVEWLDTVFMPVLKSEAIMPEDMLRTMVEHMAVQIGGVLNSSNSKSVLITGGGAFNAFFVSRLKACSEVQIVIPNKEFIAFKEAIIFAFLGVLRLLNIPNILASVTGAKTDHVSGVIHHGY